ncbi:MAG: L,D-transpeptidase family protein [Pseudomonadota bacterium]
MPFPGLNNACRSLAVPLIAISVAGCVEFSPYASSPATPTLSGKRVELVEPSHPNRFVIDSADDDVIGAPQIVLAGETDTLSDLAREYGLGYDEIVAANPTLNPWLPGEGAPVLLPTEYVLPDGPREGIVLNLAARRVFYFPETPVEGDESEQLVLTFPVGIGRVGWETPLGEATVISKAVDPTWYPPASVRREHAEMGDPLPAVVPPGPDNPLGTRVLKLDMPGYLLHGTNQPYGVGMRVSHGCVRLYPENIEWLYDLVDVGEAVRIVNQPYLLGQRDGEWFFEGHEPLEDDAIDPVERLETLLADKSLEAALEDEVRALASIGNGVAARISAFDAVEVLARASHVENTVEIDPDAPTLEEVRQMIDEAVAEAETAESVAAGEGT